MVAPHDGSRAGGKRGIPLFAIFRENVRFALRTLRRDRGFAAVVVLVLGFGIGANIAVFSLVNTILMRPLPFREPHRLVWFASNEGKGGLSDQTYTVSAFEEFRAHNRSFEDVTSYQTFFNSIQYKLIGQSEPIPLTAIEVAENFFPLLGVQPSRGRLFTREESRKGGRPAALLTHGFWQRQFGGDPGIIGRTISIQSSPAGLMGAVTVVGILPATFDFGSIFSPGMHVDVVVPAYMDFWRTWGNTLAVIGRLRPGVSVRQAQEEADTLFPQLRVAHRDWFEDYKSLLTSLQDHVSGRLRLSLLVLWCAVGLMLLIACINVSNLLLARGISRSKELALRAALGAKRGRLIGQLLTEALVLSVAGSAMGLMVAWVIIGALARQTQMALPLLSTVRLDGAALMWTVLTAVAAAALFGIAPALRISSLNPQEVLKSSGAGMSPGRAYERLRSTLVVSQIALACVLLIGAGLLLRSFVNLLDVNLGFAPAHVAAIKIEVNDDGKRERRGPVLQVITERVRAIPGVEAVGMTDMLPLDRNRSWGFVAPENVNDHKRHGAFVYVITPGYLEAMGMRLRSGRDISWRDRSSSPCVVVINETAARREWPGRDPIGRTAYGTCKGGARIVGVISDVRESSLEAHADAQVYIPMTQADPEGAELVIRSRAPIAALQPIVLSTLRSLNSGQPRTEFRAIQEIVDHAVSPRRFLMLLVASFAALGLIIASLGIYGLISYSVTRQSHEIGIRMALGATAGRVQRRVIADTLRLALAGIGAGAVAALAVAKVIASLLFGTKPIDPLVFTAMALVLVLVGLLAGYVPARRASRIDPMTVLRGL